VGKIDDPKLEANRQLLLEYADWRREQFTWRAKGVRSGDAMDRARGDAAERHATALLARGTATPEVPEANDAEFLQGRKEAFDALQSGDPKEALARAETLLRWRQPNPGLHAVAAQSYLRLERPDEALRLLRQARAEFPDDAQLAHLLGATELSLRRFAEAEATLTQALALAPEHAGALSDRAVVRKELGRPVEALADATAGCRAGQLLACQLQRDLNRAAGSR